MSAPPRWPTAALVVLALTGAGCSLGGSGAEGAGPSTTVPPDTTTTMAEPSSAPPTAPPPPTTTTRPIPAVPAGGPARAVTTATGVIAAVVSQHADGSFTLISPCGREVRVRSGAPIPGAHVVLDPGHGGSEPGAVGPGGLKESDLNLAVAREAQRALEEAGVAVVLTRTGDYRMTLASRGRVASALGAEAFVSIHHNAGPDRMQPAPGTEMYYQVNADDRTSRRLAGLLHEETVAALSAYDITWAAFREAGVKVRLNARGEDYYGILRVAPGIPSALAELSYLTNPAEEALLSTAEFRAVEAHAVARAIVRYLTTDDAGTGYVGPSDRSEPAGPGGGSQGCVDPPLE
jgi:N-acetylmuramoyl-L-alanine amidase